MNEQILTGKKYRVLADEATGTWNRISFWNKAADTEMNDGTTVEKKVTDLTESLNNFSFQVIDGKKQVSIDGGQTWENFNNGTAIEYTNYSFGYSAADSGSVSVSVPSGSKKGILIWIREDGIYKHPFKDLSIDGVSEYELLQQYEINDTTDVRVCNTYMCNGFTKDSITLTVQRLSGPNWASSITALILLIIE